MSSVSLDLKNLKKGYCDCLQEKKCFFFVLAKCKTFSEMFFDDAMVTHVQKCSTFIVFWNNEDEVFSIAGYETD